MIPMIRNGREDRDMGSGIVLSPKIKTRMARIVNRIPLNGFPDIQANIATDKSGRHKITPNSLFDGCHFASRNAIIA
jgi:hypothetical protein